MTTSTEKSFFDLHITGLGYLSRIREVKPKNVFTISSWVCGRGFGRSASLQILAIAKLLLWFAPRNPSPTASPTPSFETMNTF